MDNVTYYKTPLYVLDPIGLSNVLEGGWGPEVQYISAAGLGPHLS